MSFMAHRWVKRAREELLKSFEERIERALDCVEEAFQPDPELMSKFIGRQKTYCDICQGFSQEELASALYESGNHAPTAVLLLASCRRNVKILFPPQYLLSEGGRIKQQVMVVKAQTPRRSFGAFNTFASKPFDDASPRGGCSPTMTPKSQAMTPRSVTMTPRSRSGRGRSRMASLLSGWGAGRTDEPKFRGHKSGTMLALAFDNDPKMQDYLMKSNSFVRHHISVPEEEQIV